MFKTIVLGLDGSEHADRALPVAEALAKADGAKVVVVHVRELVATRGGAHPVHVDEDELEAKVRGQVEQLRQAGVDAELQLASIAMGGPAQVIADIAADSGADLVVVGTRGHSVIAGLLVGGVTQRLLHLVHCPVLAVPPAA